MNTTPALTVPQLFIDNDAGCDSIVTLNLTILNSTSGVDVQNHCDSYTWIDGNTYIFSDSTITHTIANIQM